MCVWRPTSELKIHSASGLLKNTQFPCTPLQRLSEHTVGPELPSTDSCKVPPCAKSEFLTHRALEAAEPSCFSQPHLQASCCTARV